MSMGVGLIKIKSEYAYEFVYAYPSEYASQTYT